MEKQREFKRLSFRKWKKLNQTERRQYRHIFPNGKIYDEQNRLILFNPIDAYYWKQITYSKNGRKKTTIYDDGMYQIEKFNKKGELKKWKNNRRPVQGTECGPWTKGANGIDGLKEDELKKERT